MVSSGALPDPSFLFAQALSGLTAAMFLFLIAAGLSLIFGVLRVLNFSHGSFYMLGAYLAYQVVQWAATTPGRFWWATIGAALGIAALGGVVERLLPWPLHRRVCHRLVPRRPGRRARHASEDDRAGHGRRDHRRGVHRRRDRRAGLVLGDVPRLHRLRPGAVLRHPHLPALLDLLGLRAHGRRAHRAAVGPPRASAAVIERLARVPWGPLVMVAAFFVPALGSRFYTFVATDVVIMGLFAVSLNLLIGYTGLVSFGHAAYFGIGAYTTGILMKKLAVPFVLAFPAAGVGAGLAALVFGFFCVRLTKIYFAMLTLAFAQIVWAICFKWNDVTGGEQGMPEIPYPALDWMQRLPFFADFRASDHFYLVTVVLVALCFWVLRRIVGSR